MCGGGCSMVDMITQKDFDEIERIMEEKMDERFRTLPTKDEFFSKMDEVMGELKGMREEHVVSQGKREELEERVEGLERIHPRGGHASV